MNTNEREPDYGCGHEDPRSCPRCDDRLATSKLPPITPRHELRHEPEESLRNEVESLRVQLREARERIETLRETADRATVRAGEASGEAERLRKLDAHSRKSGCWCDEIDRLRGINPDIDTQDTWQKELPYLFRSWSALYAENQRLRDENEWRDIESAPKNGKRIHLGFRHMQGFDVIGHWSKSANSGKGAWSLTGDGVDATLLHGRPEPSHWRPLPSPPLTTTTAETETKL